MGIKYMSKPQIQNMILHCSLYSLMNCFLQHHQSRFHSNMTYNSIMIRQLEAWSTCQMDIEDSLQTHLHSGMSQLDTVCMSMSQSLRSSPGCSWSS